MLVRVVAPHFVAGFVMEDGKITACAPILRRHVMGKTADQIRSLCKAKGWRASIVMAGRA